jgi:GNAT superfamily N-acetyltransferase
MPDRVFPIVRLVRRLPRDDLSGLHRFCGRIDPVAGDDALAIAALASAQDPLTGGRRAFSGAGLVEELTSRPGRGVSAWLAWGDAESARSPRALGLITLVAAGHGERVRHSVAWLLVDPHDRRRGVGTALVNVALEAAARAGATEVWVETHATWPAATAFWERLGFGPR